MVSIRNLISKAGSKAVASARAGQPMVPPGGAPPQQGGNGQIKVTNAGIIYCLGAGVIYILAFYHLASASWFNGIMLLVPATSLAFLGYRYMQ